MATSGGKALMVALVAQALEAEAALGRGRRAMEPSDCTQRRQGASAHLLLAGQWLTHCCCCLRKVQLSLWLDAAERKQLYLGLDHGLSCLVGSQLAGAALEPRKCNFN